MEERAAFLVCPTQCSTVTDLFGVIEVIFHTGICVKLAEAAPRQLRCCEGYY